MDAEGTAAITDLRSGWTLLRAFNREDVALNPNRGSQAAIFVYRLGRALVDYEENTGRRPARPFRVLYRVSLMLLGLPQGCQLDPRASIGRRLHLPHGGNGIVISPEVVIGDDVTIFHQVTLGARDTRETVPGSPTVEDGVVVYAGAKVIGPVTLGRGAQVGANAVVTRDVAPGINVGGIPARPLRSQP